MEMEMVVLVYIHVPSYMRCDYVCVFKLKSNHTFFLAFSSSPVHCTYSNLHVDLSYRIVWYLASISAVEQRGVVRGAMCGAAERTRLLCLLCMTFVLFCLSTKRELNNTNAKRNS